MVTLNTRTLIIAVFFLSSVAVGEWQLVVLILDGVDGTRKQEWPLSWNRRDLDPECS